MLALMETLADFGTVSVFNYDTFTTAIYKAWYALFSLAGGFAACLIADRDRVCGYGPGATIPFSHALRRKQAQCASWPCCTHRLACADWSLPLPLRVLFSLFMLPVSQLAIWAVSVSHSGFQPALPGISLAFPAASPSFAALLTCSVTLLVVYAVRRHSDPLTRAAVRISTIGYALPGAVLAVGIFIPVAWLDNWLSEMASQLFHIETGLIIQGTLFTMLIAYMTRFLAVSHSPIDSAMQRITESIDEAATGLGLSGWAMLSAHSLAHAEGGICHRGHAGVRGCDERDAHHSDDPAFRMGYAGREDFRNDLGGTMGAGCASSGSARSGGLRPDNIVYPAN